MIAPLLSLMLLMMGSGLFNTFVSLRLQIEGHNTQTIGVITSLLYVGILIGSGKVGPWIERKGHQRALMHFALLLTFFLGLQALWINPWFWGGLRCLGGICIAGIFIVMESWILLTTPREKRGLALALYLTLSYTALSLGQLLFALLSPHSLWPYLITGCLTLSALLPLLVKKTKDPKNQQHKKISLRRFYRTSSLGALGGLVGGMILSSIYGLVPLYARHMGLSFTQIGYLMAFLLFGGLSLQWPLGYWSDRKDRRRALIGVSLCTMILALSIVWIGSTSLGQLLPSLWLFGGFAFAIYPLSLSYMCEKVMKEEVVSATGAMIFFYGTGAILGPLIAPIAMHYLGAEGLFYFLALLTGILAVVGWKTQTLKIETPLLKHDDVQEN